VDSSTDTYHIIYEHSKSGYRKQTNTEQSNNEKKKQVEANEKGGPLAKLDTELKCSEGSVLS